MDWLHSYGSLRDHPKTKKLARLLGVKMPAAVGHLHCLWWWSMDYAPDGDLTDVEPDVIADGAGWDGDPQVFIDALINATKEKGGYGFLENGDRLLIHDHEEYIGRYLTKAAKEAARKRKERAERPADGRRTSEGQPASASASSGRTADVLRTGDGRTADVQGTSEGCPSRDAHALTEETEETEPPLPPQPVHNSADPERGCSIEQEGPGPEPPVDGSGDGLAASKVATTDNLEDLRHNPLCADAECPVRTLRVGVRGIVAQIVGPGEAGNLYNESTPLHRALAGMAGYICAACWRASATEYVTMADRQPICRRALVAYVDILYQFHRTKTIRSLPAFLRTRYGNMTEAPVSDELLAELRELERQPGERSKGEPVRAGEVVRVPERGVVT